VQTITAGEAKAKFSELLRKAEAGDEVVVTRNGTAVAKLVPIQPRVAGGMRDEIEVVDEAWWSADPDLADQFGITG